jgi:hypothetical protein
MRSLRLRLCVAWLLLFVGANAGATIDTDSVLGFERDLWNAWQRHDLAAIEALTALDYSCVDERGPAGAIGLAEIRRDFAKYDLRDFKLGPMSARVLTPFVITIVYNAHMSGSSDGKDVSRGVAEASTWVKRNGRWRNVLLHEITRAERDGAVDP